MDAAVMAKLQRLGTNATGGTYPEIHVPLLDLGTGGESLLCLSLLRLDIDSLTLWL